MIAALAHAGLIVFVLWVFYEAGRQDAQIERDHREPV